MTGASYEKEGHGPIKPISLCRALIHSTQIKMNLVFMSRKKKTLKNRANRVNELGRMRGVYNTICLDTKA